MLKSEGGTTVIGYNVSTPAGELQERIKKFQKILQDKEIAGSLIIQKTDLFYFSGTSQQGWLYIPAEGEPLLMIFKEFDRAQAESSLEQVCSIVSPKKIPETLAEGGYQLPVRLGMELDVLPVNLYFLYQTIFPQTEIVDISIDIRLVRAVKSSYELDLIRQAARYSDQVAAKVVEFLQVGKSEVTLAGELEGYARSLGHQGIVRMRLWGSELFYGHLLSGPAAAVPSYLASPTGGEGVSPLIGQGAGFKTIGRDETILFDYVFGWKGYLSDHTRIFCIGSLPDELLKAHECMLEIQEEIKAVAVPGAVTGDIYEQMISLAADRGIGDHFMGTGDRKIRFTGHGIGLELDEFPFLAKGQKMVLEKGMIIALEPKAILPGKGVVGIENTHVVTEQGLEPLTRMSDKITFI
jgi:Xaa-Pro dipeptidase